MKQSWKASLHSHGTHLVTGAHVPFYTVGMTLVLDREPERLIEQTFINADEAEGFGYSMVEMALKARSHTIAQAAGHFKHEGGQTDVHTEHCCLWHGCQYGDEDCPVVAEAKPQSYICESCGTEMESVRELIEDMLHFRNTRRKNQRAREAERKAEHKAEV